MSAATHSLPDSGTTTPQEEAFKRNTDCLYFLASPLTCKKGSECEYRHSDIARVNPRDCWFWLNGNCLNSKCGFRHPPLDGLLGSPATTPAVHSLPSSAAVAAQGPSVPGKQAVPCVFFQQGYCLKGDKCAFMHAPYSLNNKATQSAAATLVPEFQPNKKTFGSLGKHIQGQSVSQTNAPKYAQLPPQAKSVMVVEKAPLRMQVSGDRNVSTATALNNELPRYMPANIHPSSNGKSASRLSHNNQVHMLDQQNTPNVKDADEFSREPSPGFDVLVDDELRDSDYYPNEDQFGRTRGNEGSTPNEYDIGNAADYNSVTDYDRDMYRDSRHYDSLEHLPGHYGWEEQRASSERTLGGSAHIERGRYPRADSPGQIAELDLRRHLSKQKRGNNLRSVINQNHPWENHADDRSYQAPQRDHLPVPENLFSSRLRGRIKIPGRSLSRLDKNDAQPEREIDRVRNRGRLSQERPLGRLRDRVKGRVQENFDGDERNFRGSRIRRNITDDNNSEFSGPKSLSELKVGKSSESYEGHMNNRQSLGKRKYPKVEGVQQVEGDISFEGPKPLSEILKRKKGVEVVLSASTNEKTKQEGKGTFMIPTETNESEVVFPSAANTEANQSHINKEKSARAAGETGLAEEKNKLHESLSSIKPDASQLQNEEGMIGDEAYDHKGGDSDYEQADGENYNFDEGENADPEDDYFDDDDDADDFAKKMGVYS